MQLRLRALSIQIAVLYEESVVLMMVQQQDGEVVQTATADLDALQAGVTVAELESDEHPNPTLKYDPPLSLPSPPQPTNDLKGGEGDDEAGGVGITLIQ